MGDVDLVKLALDTDFFGQYWWGQLPDHIQCTFDPRYQQDFPAIIWAVAYEQVEMIELLLRSGASINIAAEIS